MIEVGESLLANGMRDLLPAEMARHRRVERAFLDACAARGYQEVRTPTLEHLYLFTSSGTLAPQLLSRVYSFLDWDGWTGERVVLRPDATIPVARLYREALRGGVAKLAYVANIFRFHAGPEPREVWQCGAELIGDTWPQGDLELVTMAAQILRSLGVAGATLRLSHTGIMRALLDQAGFLPDEQVELYDRLLDGDTSVLREVEVRVPHLGAALELLGSVEAGSSGYLANLRSAFLPAVPGMQRPLDELSLIERTASLLGLATEVTVAGARDFEYYTGPVFQLASGDSVLAGGGRYDRLVVDAQDRQVPACGFALHVDELAALLQDEPPAAGAVLVRARSSEPEMLAAAFNVAEWLQQRGLAASLVEAESGGAALSVGREGYQVERVRGGAAVQVATLDGALAALRGA
ncbi:MAG TPA: ATP phosphoribosyltransferase regulatory subunit [Dehalococcoidia bacterium]|nr:ATP phosphoribosyltransferase regulatory subunit [Dehalococcoidia bacterium]